MRTAFRRLKDHAKERGIPFALTFFIFRRFAIRTDYLNRTGPTGHCLTVDRRNNLKGYTPRNIQPLTRSENAMKQARRDAIRLQAGFAWKENLDIYVIQKISAKVTKAGATTAPFDLLSRLVARIEATRISISQDKNTIAFKAGDVTATIETLPSEEFPPPLKQEGASAKECDAEDILKPFSMLEHGMCDDSSRYLLMGINLSPGTDGTDFTATSGYRIVSYKGAEITNADVIVPDIFVRAVLRIAPSGSISVKIADGTIALISQDIEIQAKLIEGKFPNWRPAIPDRSDQALSCGRKPLIRALQTCALFANNQVPGLFLSGKGKEIEVSLPEKAAVMVLGTELAGQPKVTIRLNAKFLIETLSVLECENVRIQLRDGDSPILIEDGPFTSVINRLLAK